MSVSFRDQQLDAIAQMKNGSILAGAVGTGKSRTAIGYFFLKVCGARVPINGVGEYQDPKEKRDLYIITTAKKRDSKEWETELVYFRLSKKERERLGIKLVVDSWNNIKKYKNIYGAFFIFDEQRLTGSGPWVSSFYAIAKKNQWILLSATPGDRWTDYIPVFVANGFYKSKTDFMRQHCVFNRFTKYPKVDKYIYEGVLLKHQRDILVKMAVEKNTQQHHINIMCSYDKELYKRVWRDRWDPYDNEPIKETGKLFYLLRKVVNLDDSRKEALLRLATSHKRLIIFYNFKSEAAVIRDLLSTYNPPFNIGEWNGEIHSEIPSTDPWAYLVQFGAGAEGWNCTKTDTVVFWSQNYSFRTVVQASGRIDRMNTEYKDLYYYHFKSPAPIDIAIERALKQKRDFNLKSFERYISKRSNKEQ